MAGATQGVRKIEKKDHWELTPWPIRSCWKKKRNGEVYYVGKGTERYTEADYKRALAEWNALAAKLDSQEREQARRWQHLEFQNYGVADLMGSATNLHPQPTPPPQPDTNRTLGNYRARFILHKTTQARTGQRSAGRLANLQSYLRQFVDFMGADSDPAQIDSARLGDYYAKLLKDVEAGKLESTSASDKFAAAKQFIRWLWSMGATELPRNIDSREMTIARTIGKITPMPLPVLRERARAATGRLKLELLLQANCGMYQGDCAKLLHKELNWRDGTITRKRSKNEKHENAPTVTYYLWPSTLELLRQHASQDSPHVLVNRNGEAGVRKTVREDGRVVNTDNTASAYVRLQNRLAKEWAKKLAEMKPNEIKAAIEAGEVELDDTKQPVMRHWPLKTIRKAGATLIGNHKEHSRFAEYYLADTPNSVTDRHYVRPSEEQFRECLQWLGQEMAIDTLDKISGS